MVSSSYSHLNRSLSEGISHEEKQDFLRHFGKTGEDWQVRQPEAALRLYDFFLSELRRDEKERSSAFSDQWGDVEERARTVLRLKHRSLSTEKTYLIWLRSFKVFVGSKSPYKLTAEDLHRFLSHLAVERKVSTSTQNQALNALVFVYRNVLDREIGNDELQAVRAAYKRRLPVVLTPKEVRGVLEQMSVVHRLMAMLIYGCGLRLHECLGLRIKDVDIEQGILIVRAGKGDKDRRTVLPDSLKDALIRHIAEIRSVYDGDREKNLNGVYLPDALNRRYPNAGKEWGQFWLFPWDNRAEDVTGAVSGFFEPTRFGLDCRRSLKSLVSIACASRHGCRQ